MATATAALKARRARAATIAEELYCEHRRRLLAIARRNSACEEDAEEALQDALILFIDHFEPDDSAPPLAWLTLTLKRRCWALYQHQRLRAAARRGRGAEAVRDTRRLPEEIVEITENVARVRLQFAELKPAQLEALGLLALGYSYREIGELTGWTYTKVNRCIAEGRAALRKLRNTDEVAEQR
jgi:RNA polymerase sigma factor (sigma-70 family)